MRRQSDRFINLLNFIDRLRANSQNEFKVSVTQENGLEEAQEIVKSYFGLNLGVDTHLPHLFFFFNQMDPRFRRITFFRFRCGAIGIIGAVANPFVQWL